MSPLRNAVLAQISGLIITVAVMKIVLPQLFSIMLVVSVVQGICAAIVSHKLGAPRWWQLIHLVFAPLALEASRLDLSPFVWLSGFVLMFLLFWRTDKSQVPLFLSNSRTAEVVATLLPEAPCEFIDLGCGTGSLLKRVALIRPDCDFLGVEHAPLPCLWAWLSCLGNSNVTIRYGNFWNCHLGKFNIVYSFLSPVPMADLWTKAKVEMSRGGILISNSFEVPQMTAARMVEVTDRRRTRLFCYNLP